jgi:cytochrome P450
MPALSDDLVRLNEPSFYHGNPHIVYEQMRREAPLYWYERGGFWVATRYDDIQHVSKATDLFSVESGVLITDVLNGMDAVSTMFPDGVENFFTADPPRHAELRSIVQFAFSRRRVLGMHDRIEEIVDAYLAPIQPGTEFEFVSGVSIPVPIEVIQAFMDLDDMPIDDAFRWSEAIFKMGSDLSEAEYKEIGASLEGMFAYFNAIVESRRSEPKDDFIGRLTASELDGKKLVNMMVEVYCQVILVAGNETTRNGISAAVKLFSDHPDQYQRLLDDETLIDSAVEEVLRYHNPTLGFMRTAKCDTEIRDTKISAGQHVYMIYGAGNRDPDVFPDPDVFDIGRFRKPFPMHITFGFAEHVCMGSALARLEMRIVLKALRSRFSKIEVVGEPERPQSLLGNGFVTMPARFTAN